MMSTDQKEDSNSQQSDVKVDSSKDDFNKSNDSSINSESKHKTKENSNKDNEKVESDKEEMFKGENMKEKSVKNETKKENEEDESDKGKNEKVTSSKGIEKNSSEDEESESEEERVGMLDRPVQVSGCRARKQVQRLEVSFNTPSKELLIPEGRGQKLGEIPLIEQQIAKHPMNDLKPLHRILYLRVGSAHEIKKNIRKFSGFAFQKNSHDYDVKKSSLEKLTAKVLKSICDILLLEKGKTKEDVVLRILDFLLCPKDSGKKLPKKKGTSQDKKKESQKKTKSKEKKAKPKESENEDVPLSASEASDNASEVDESDSETKPKSKTKGKKKPAKVKIAAVKIAKPESQPEKGIKRKKEVASESENEEEEKPAAKKSKIPEDDEIVKLIEKILEGADLQEITMKKVIKEVFDTYPEVDLMHKKSFIKTTIKAVIS